MKELKEMLFSMQKFQIMSQFTNSATEKKISAPYAYAWEKGVFPILDEVAEWHKPFADVFPVQEDMLKELIEYLQERFEKEIPITYYELEEHYGIKVAHVLGGKWSRFMLAHACRYLCLHKKFSETFWVEMIEDGKSPIEMKCILREYCPEEVSFEQQAVYLILQPSSLNGGLGFLLLNCEKIY